MNYQDNINSSVKFGSVIHYSPQAIERSYSPLIETYDETNPTVHKETWKLTTSPQRSQSIRNSATTIKELPKEPLSVTFKRSCSSLLPQTKSKRKELPPIPITSLHNDSYCELSLTQYQNMAWLPPLREVANSYYEDRSFDYQQHLQEAPHCAVPSEEYSKFDCPYTKHRTDYQSRPSLSTIDDYYVYSPTESTITEEQEDNIMARPTKEDYYCPEASETPPRPQIPSPKTQDEDKSVRQITVKCVTDDYRVWITIEPEETGKSIAKKIETLASFRTCKVTSITTASGRKIALNKVPIFMHWTNIDNFEHGETWTVTWGPLKKLSLVDMVLSKLIQV